MTGHDGYDDISVAAAGGTTPEALKAAISRELGKEFAVRTGKEQAEKQAQDLSDALGFIRTALLVFAAVALLVGSFLIFNTFSVTVAQRTKEFALLRTLGASRGQVLRSVLAETFVIGVLASLIGHRLRPRARARPGGAAVLVRDRPRHHQHGAGAADHHRRPRGGDRGHRRLGLRARPARDPDRARGRDARQRHARRRPRPQAADRGRRGGRGDRRRAAALRPARRPGRRQRHRDGARRRQRC